MYSLIHKHAVKFERSGVRRKKPEHNRLKTWSHVSTNVELFELDPSTFPFLHWNPKAPFFLPRHQIRTGLAICVFLSVKSKNKGKAIEGEAREKKSRIRVDRPWNLRESHT